MRLLTKRATFILLIFCSVLLFSFVFAGCSPEEVKEPEEGAPEESTEEVIELTFSTLFPEPHCTNEYLHYPIAKEIEEETDGRVKIEIHPGATLGEGEAHYDMAVDGVADITQGIQGFTEGRFPLTSVVELPFLFPPDMNAETANRIVWELYENVPALQEEYEDVKVLANFVNEPGHVYTAGTQVKTFDDFRGLDIRSPMATAASMLEELGASPVTMPTGDLYMSLERGVVDGTLFNTANMDDWGFWEVVDYKTKGGFYNLAWFTVMNKETWNELPEDVQEIIDEKYGMDGGIRVGKGFDADYEENIEIAKEHGVEIYELPEEERKKWEEATEVVHENWVEDMEEQGLPGREVLDEVNRLIEEYK